jgi:hypothetical protein
MDWFTLLLIFIFFILPLIQQVLERSRKGGDLPPIETEEAFEMEEAKPRRRERAEAAAERAREEATEADVVDWSHGWGKWPGAEEESPVAAEEPRREAPVYTAPQPPPAPTAPPARPFGGPESPRKARRAAEPLPPARAPLQEGVATLTRRHGKQQRAAVARLLDSQADVRRAIVLSEVLGPPKSLRPPGSETGGRA